GPLQSAQSPRGRRCRARRMGHIREQPPGEVLLPHRERPQTATASGRELEALCRHGERFARARLTACENPHQSSPAASAVSFGFLRRVSVSCKTRTTRYACIWISGPKYY